MSRLNGTFPGLDFSAIGGASGLSTPTLVRLADVDGLVSGVDRAIDRVFATGDLSSRRATVVSGMDHHAHQLLPDSATARSTPTATLNLEPFVGRRQLLEGNTLNLNDAHHRIGGAVQAVCDDLTMALRAHCQVNVYVSKGDAPGFGAHWDDHDVIVIPVSGAKYWEVEEPHELGSIKDVTPVGGTGRSVWSGVLRRGDALAIPRGWPHSVSGLGDDVSVHLTASIRRPTSLDLLAHLPPELLDDDITFGRDEHEHCLGSWCSILTSPPAFGPIELTGAAGSGFDGVRLGVVLPGGAVFVREGCDERKITMAANNRTLDFGRPLAPVVARLIEGFHTVDELVSTTGVPRADVIELVDVLGGAGLIRMEACG